MVKKFKVPLSFCELEYVKEETIGLERLVDVSRMNDEERQSLHEKFHKMLCGGSSKITDIMNQSTFDLAYSVVDYVRKSDDVAHCLKAARTFNRSLSDFLATFDGDESSKTQSDALEGIPRSSVCNAIRAHVYFVVKICEVVASSVKGQTSSEGRAKNPAQVVRCVGILKQITNTFIDMLRVVCKFWECGVPEESFLNLFLKFSQKIIAEKIIVGNASMRASAASLVALLGKKFPTSATSIRVAMQQLLVANEHCCDPIVEVIRVLVEEHDDTQFVAEFLQEAIAKDFDGSRDSAGIKNIATFISSLSTKLPALMYANTSIFLPLLNSTNYSVRNAVITSLGQLCIACARGTTSLAGNGSARDTFLDLLQERIFDVTAFTRSRCLKVWSALCEEKAIPVQRVLVVTNLAIGRTSDKSAIVRKSAMRLLQCLVSRGPFGHDLSMGACVKRHAKAKDDLRILEIAEAEEAERALSGATPSEDRLESSAARRAKIKVVEFYDSIVQFITMLESCVPRLCRLLHSKSASDVTGALHLVAAMHEARLQRADVAAQRMLELVWSTKQEFRTAMIDTFHTMHIDGIPPAIAASRMIFAAIEASPGALASLTAVVGALQKDQRIPKPLSAVLWRAVRSVETATSLVASVFCDRVASNCASDVRCVQRGALVVVSMMCVADASTGLKGGRLESVLKILLDNQRSASPDWAMVQYACLILQHADVTEHSSRLADISVRVLKALLLHGFGSPVEASADKRNLCATSASECDDTWYAAAEQAVNALMRLCPLPSEKYVLSCSENDEKMGTIRNRLKPEDVFEKIVRRMSTILTTSEDDVSLWKLGHAVFVVGHVAVKVLVRAEQLAKLAKALRVAKAKAASQKSSEASKSEDSDDAVARELGLHASSDHKEDEEVASIARDGILGKQLLGVFGPILVRIVANENGRYSFLSQKDGCDGEDARAGATNLRAAAMISFCKFMCISRRFCQEKLPVLFTALQRRSEPARVRISAIVALSDLTTRFPNELEPWNKRLYMLLGDSDVSVRKNVLMVLTHLVLNDMIKVKGCTHELAKCIEDSDASIRGLARLFFSEFASKANNNIYNILPDTLGQLSADPDVDAPTYRRIARFLVQYIEREWHIESLVSKMCHRIGGTTKATRWLDFIFCLSLFPYSERTFKCISGLFKTYKDALANSRDAHAKFTSGIVAKCKKLCASNPELEGSVNEWVAQVHGLSRNAMDSTITAPCDNDENSDVANLPGSLDAVEKRGAGNALADTGLSDTRVM